MPGINWALASSGGVASASSSSAYFAPPSALNDGERAGSALGRSGNVWQNFADAGGPVWAQIALPAVRAIDAVVVYSQQTLFLAPVEPYADMRTLSQQMHAFHQDYDLLLTPTIPITASWSCTGTRLRTRSSSAPTGSGSTPAPTERASSRLWRSRVPTAGSLTRAASAGCRLI